jgi:hypothetical protein
MEPESSLPCSQELTTDRYPVIEFFDWCAILHSTLLHKIFYKFKLYL